MKTAISFDVTFSALLVNREPTIGSLLKPGTSFKVSDELHLFVARPEGMAADFEEVRIGLREAVILHMAMDAGILNSGEVA